MQGVLQSQAVPCILQAAVLLLLSELFEWLP